MHQLRGRVVPAVKLLYQLMYTTIMRSERAFYPRPLWAAAKQPDNQNEFPRLTCKIHRRVHSVFDASTPFFHSSYFLSLLYFSDFSLSLSM